MWKSLGRVQIDHTLWTHILIDIKHSDTIVTTSLKHIEEFTPNIHSFGDIKLIKREEYQILDKTQYNSEKACFHFEVVTKSWPKMI